MAPTAGECRELLDHAVALGMEEQRAKQPADHVPTATEQDRVRAALHPFSDECPAMSRDAYRCARAASSLTELAGCQPTPSSSTSNSSVAPGGITPPAP